MKAEAVARSDMKGSVRSDPGGPFCVGAHGNLQRRTQGTATQAPTTAASGMSAKMTGRSCFMAIDSGVTGIGIGMRDAIKGFTAMNGPALHGSGMVGQLPIFPAVAPYIPRIVRTSFS